MANLAQQQTSLQQQNYIESLIKAGKIPFDPSDPHLTTDQMKWVYSAFQNQTKKKPLKTPAETKAEKREKKSR